MKKSFFYRIMVLGIGALLAGIVACKNPASPDSVKPAQNVQKPSDNGSGGGGGTNPGGQTPGSGIVPPVNQKTDQEKVDAAKAALELRVNGKVRDRIHLPKEGQDGVKIGWTSSPIGIINTNAPDFGKVTRQDNDAVVTLTATITKGSATATKPFTVTVYGKNQELVDQAVQQMQQPPAFVMGSGTETMSLQKTSGPVNFEWKAEPKDIIDVETGTVTQPAEKKTVTLTATAKKGHATASRPFTVTVYPKNQEPAPTELLTQIMDTIPAETDKHIPLIGTPANGYTLTWTSSNPDVLDPSRFEHNVTRDLVDRKVTLKAEVRKKKLR